MLLSINLQGTSIGWSFEEDLWIPNYASCWFTVKGSALKPHDFLNTWPMWGHMMIWKIYISTFTKFMNTKLGSILTSARRPSTQTLRLSPTSCIFTSLKLFHVSIILFPRKLKNSTLVFRFLKKTTYSNKARARTNKY